LSLALETGENLRIAGDVVGKEFECDKTMQAGVFGFVDYAHAAAAESFEDAIMRERLSHEGRRVGHVGAILAGSGKTP
jgi:hypothetical protein